MRNTIARILTAIANAMRGFWKATVKGGKATMEWIAEKGGPAVGEAFVDVADTVGRTAHAALHAVPNLIHRFTGNGPAVAPAPSAEAAPVAEQQAARQAVLDASAQDDRKRALAITTKAAARSLLRGQEPSVAVSAPVRLWLSSLDERELGTLAAMSVEDVTRALDGDDNQPLGRGMRVAAWERTARNNPAALAYLASRPAPAAEARAPEQATPVLDMKAALEARARDRLQRRLRGMGAPLPGETLEPIAVRL